MKDVLQTGCLAAGVLCLIYYILVICYAGITTSLSPVWLFGGVLLLFLGGVMRFLKQHPESQLRWPAGVLFTLLALGLAAALLLGVRVIRGMTQEPRSGLDFVIVLGAQVRGTRPSRALRRRLDAAAEYAAENPDTVFVLSGGQGPDEEISEAECMYRYLTQEKGIDAGRLLLEDRSTSTRENLQFSAELIDRNKSVGILSNNFHICRALALARAQGYPDPAGIPASSDLLMQPHNVMREICCLAAELARGSIRF